MGDVGNEVRCACCGARIDEATNAKSADREPCSKCGSTLRHFNVSIADKLEFHASLAYKAKKTGRGKPYLEGKSGDDLQHKTGKWMKREMAVDHEKDQYRELVTDPESGKVIHHCDEPLSKHREHGSAKKKKIPPAQSR